MKRSSFKLDFTIFLSVIHPLSRGAMDREAVQPDLVKFHHFGQYLSVWQLYNGLFIVFGINFSILWQYFNVVYG